MYLDYDLRSGAHVAARTWGGLAPLYCGVSRERASRLLVTTREFAVALDGGWAVPSVSAEILRSTRPATGGGRSGR